MTRRTFGTRAALFVLGCALQVGGAASLLKQVLVAKAEQIQAGMIFNPKWNCTAAGRAEVWRVLEVVPGSRPDSTPHILCALHSREYPPFTEAHPAMQWAEQQQRLLWERKDREPRLHDTFGRISEYNFHFPGI